MTGRTSIWLWAARDLLRSPWQSLLIGAALASVIVAASVPVLFSRGLSESAKNLLQEGPSIVARRISAGQWAPIPVEEAVEAAESVPGVTSARPRIWGTVGGPDGPVTVVGQTGQRPEKTGKPKKSAEPTLFPARGEAIVGYGTLSGNESEQGEGNPLALHGEKSLSFEIAGTFDKKHSMAVHDVVLLHEDDARELLGLAPGFASDLAIRVFHEQEADAVLPDLADAFPWPSRMTTRGETLKMYTASTARRGGLFYLVLAPCILALALICAAGSRASGRGDYEAGLLKALGWTTRDIVRLFVYRAILVAAPSSAAASALSVFLMFRPGIAWPGYLFFGWKHNPPGFFMDPSGAIPALMLSVAAVLTPYLASALWPAVACASADPCELLRREDGL